jgi:hypothetical protein
VTKNHMPEVHAQHTPNGRKSTEEEQKSIHKKIKSIAAGKTVEKIIS